MLCFIERQQFSRCLLASHSSLLCPGLLQTISATCSLQKWSRPVQLVLIASKSNAQHSITLRPEFHLTAPIVLCGRSLARSQHDCHTVHWSRAASSLSPDSIVGRFLCPAFQYVWQHYYACKWNIGGGSLLLLHSTIKSHYKARPARLSVLNPRLEYRWIKFAWFNIISRKRIKYPRPNLAALQILNSTQSVAAFTPARERGGSAGRSSQLGFIPTSSAQLSRQIKFWT